MLVLFESKIEICNAIVNRQSLMPVTDIPGNSWKWSRAIRTPSHDTRPKHRFANIDKRVLGLQEVHHRWTKQQKLKN